MKSPWSYGAIDPRFGLFDIVPILIGKRRTQPISPTLDEIGFGVLEERGDLDWVMVSVQRMTLGLEHARMESAKDTYLYERPDRVTLVGGGKD